MGRANGFRDANGEDTKPILDVELNIPADGEPGNILEVICDELVGVEFP